MKFSQSLIPTQRQAPSDAEVVSHKLLVRAGFIRKVTSGVYEFLPLGLRSLKKVENIVREEMNAAAAQELFLPHLVPIELWQQSGRADKYGKELLRIDDRHERGYCFGPTHEETICDLVSHTVSSYKQLPMNLYQIQTKFRDERRPRYGLMRGREFLMKDAYSFHSDTDDLDREYQVMHETYLNIFKRCGLACRAVDADPGTIGGSSSHEFMVMAETGEDQIATCTDCCYAANIEKATFNHAVSKVTPSEKDVVEELTPNMKNIEEVSEFLKIEPKQMIKTLIYKADESWVIVCLSGDREVSDIKLSNLVDGDDIRLATDEEIDGLTGVPVGFLGPLGMKDCIKGKMPNAKYKIIYDHSLLAVSSGATGSNKKDYHTINIDIKRDLGLDEERDVVDVSSVLADDPCPECEGNLRLMRGIEVGHIFKLGTKYSEPMKATFLDKNGKSQNMEMGTYGIGIGRTMAASVEQSHDDRGIVWPRALAPYEIHLANLDFTDEILAFTKKLYDDLNELGISVLWDDRDERAGVKFNDADLIGCPLQIIVGKRGFEKGKIEFKIRQNGEKGDLSLDGTIQAIQEKLNTL